MSSLITNIFQGQTFNTVKCCTCNFKHISFDNFLSLSLTLPKSSTRYTHQSGLDKCFNDFTKEEDIPSVEGYKCKKCKVPVSIKKQSVIWRAPPVLIVHLKRFYVATWRKEKLDTLIEYDTNLDFKPYCGESSNF